MSNSNRFESEFVQIENNDEWKQTFMNVGVKSSGKVLSYKQATHPMNIKYNRYRDILPYDHTRVKLKDAQGETDYINANFVECPKANRKYILAQGPLKNTCEHFWQMIWEQNSKGIIMLNKLYEKGACKCEMYYPNVDEEQSEFTLEFGKFKLNYSSERPSVDYAIRTIECENTQLKEKRDIYHCHFTNWPDFGEPEYTDSFLSFLNDCRKLNLFNSKMYGPPVVHCSAGVGRSGTFILVDSIVEMYKLFGSEQMPYTVSELLAEFRSQRMGLVQTPMQFRFAYRAIADAVNASSSQTLSIEEPSVERSQENDSFSSDDSSEEDDEEENTDFDTLKSQLANRNKNARPATGQSNRGGIFKKFRRTQKNENHIKELRILQMKNRNEKIKEKNSDESPDEELFPSTAVSRNKNNNKNISLNTTDDSITKVTVSSNSEFLPSSKNDLSSEQDELSSDETDESPFALNNRNISTVKVNEKRKSLEPLASQQESTRQSSN